MPFLYQVRENLIKKTDEKGASRPGATSADRLRVGGESPGAWRGLY